MELKNDISAALELSEELLQSPHLLSSVDLACEVRGRLSQALQRATDFFESNIELLATIASLKREALERRQEQEEEKKKLTGRITCLIDIVREQQESLEKKQQVLSLRGIWANLLRVSPDGVVRHPQVDKRVEEGRSDEEEVDEYAANVITWLSLQCAQEAKRPDNQHSRRSTTSEDQIGNGLNGINSVGALVQKINSLFRAVDSATQVTEQENKEMRVKLQEMSAICTALRRERDEKSAEVEKFRDALCVLQSDHEYANNQVTMLSEENKRLKVLCDTEKENSDNWRTKCHEILEALEKTSEATSLYQDNSRHSLYSNHRTVDHSSLYNQKELFLSKQISHISSLEEISPLGSTSTRKYSLDHCDLVEEPEVLKESPPTPLVRDTQRTSLSDVTGDTTHEGIYRNSSDDVETVKQHSEGLTTSLSLTPCANDSKRIEPMDPRELDDSTLYKMIVEAENENDELRRSGSSSYGSLNKSHEEDAHSQLNAKEISPISVTNTALFKNVEDDYVNTPVKTKSRSWTPSKSPFEATSYDTPIHANIVSDQFSKSVQLKNISATKSVTKEWNNYFTRGTLKESKSMQSPYDVVLNRFRSPQYPRQGCANEREERRTFEKKMHAISPIPLSTGK